MLLQMRHIAIIAATVSCFLVIYSSHKVGNHARNRERSEEKKVDEEDKGKK